MAPPKLEDVEQHGCQSKILFTAIHEYRSEHPLKALPPKKYCSDKLNDDEQHGVTGVNVALLSHQGYLALS